MKELTALKRYLDQLNELVEDEDYEALENILQSEKEKDRLQKLIGEADQCLTDKRRGEYSVSEILSGGVEIVHLSDAGWTRLSLRITEKPVMWMDIALATRKPKERWMAWTGGMRYIP